MTCFCLRLGSLLGTWHTSLRPGWLDRAGLRCLVLLGGKREYTCRTLSWLLRSNRLQASTCVLPLHPPHPDADRALSWWWVLSNPVSFPAWKECVQLTRGVLPGTSLLVFSTWTILPFRLPLSFFLGFKPFQRLTSIDSQLLVSFYLSGLLLPCLPPLVLSHLLCHPLISSGML